MATVSDAPARLATRVLFLVAGFGYSCWAPLIPLTKARLGLDENVLGLLLCIGVGSILAMAVTGALAARHGTRPLLIVSGFGFAAALAALPLAGSVAALGLNLLAFGAMLAAPRILREGARAGGTVFALPRGQPASDAGRFGNCSDFHHCLCWHTGGAGLHGLHCQAGRAASGILAAGGAAGLRAVLGAVAGAAAAGDCLSTRCTVPERQSCLAGNGLMVNDTQLVTFRVTEIGAVVVGVVVRPQARRALAAAAMG